MTLSPDLIAFVITLLRGAQLCAQALAIGGIVFLLALAEPLAPALNGAKELVVVTRRWTGRAAIMLAAVAAASVAAGIFQLSAVLRLSVPQSVGADFVRWGALMIVASGAAAILCHLRGRAAMGALAVSGLAVLIASVMSSHAGSRIDDQSFVFLADLLHQGGASTWIGGIPFLLLALQRIEQPGGRFLAGSRFSHIAMAAVGSLACGALMLLVGFGGSITALVGTAYGAMAAAKAALLAVLLLLGLMNMLAVRRLSRGGDPSLFHLRRFAEVEIAIGVSVFFVAASLASQPPAIDQAAAPGTIASMEEIAAHLAPEWPPTLTSPPHEKVTMPDRETGVVASTTDADRAWSDFNHHWAGICVLLMGLLSLADRSGARWARHWPLVFLGLAAMLFVRSDPETWPLGPIPFFARLSDPEVMQHRLLTLLIAAFAVFEWSVRTGHIQRRWARLSFPLLCAVGGTLLLAHSHLLTDVKQRYLIEITHIPMGVAGIIAGWSRWLELRSDGLPARVAGWVWPVCLALVGLMLLDYRE